MKIKLAYMIIPNAATPSSPASFTSRKLYKRLTIDVERLETISEEPFKKVRSSTLG